MYLLDTDICIYLIKRRPLAVIERLMSLRPSEVGISSVTLSELAYGVEKSQEVDRNRGALEMFLAPLEIWPYDAAAAGVYGRIRADLERRGRVIGPLDLMIAAHAASLGWTLVTNNLREFSRIPDLQAENWVKA